MKLLIAILLFILLALHTRLWLGQGGYKELRDLQREVLSQSKDNEQLEARNRSLEAEVADLTEKTDAIEERARSEMGMIRDGEVFIQPIEAVNGAISP